MKNILVLFLVLISCGIFAQQTWWVSNAGGIEDIDFTTLSEAVAAAGVDDTIMIYPSPTRYTATLDKKLHLIGVGYDLCANIECDDELSRAQTSFAWLSYDPTSSGSTITSLYINSQTNSHVTINVEEVSFIQCRFSNNLDWSGSNNRYLKCYFDGSYYMIEESGNVTLENCIIVGGNNYFHGQGMLIKNCYLGGSNYLTQESVGLFVNNYMNGVYSVPLSSQLYNNIYVNGLLATNGNIASNSTAVFGPVGDRSFDLRFTLAPGSPALGAGLGGVDCGPYGGPTPYRPSGVYDRPLIYQLNTPVEVPAGQDMNVNLKVKINNDGE